MNISFAVDGRWSGSDPDTRDKEGGNVRAMMREKCTEDSYQSRTHSRLKRSIVSRVQSL